MPGGKTTTICNAQSPNRMQKTQQPEGKQNIWPDGKCHLTWSKYTTEGPEDVQLQLAGWLSGGWTGKLANWMMGAMQGRGRDNMIRQQPHTWTINL
eukprot:10076031-Karenia_brevis.AAC.1